MAIRISRRVKYVVVLAIITVLLYGSFETDSLSGLKFPETSSILPLKYDSSSPVSKSGTSTDILNNYPGALLSEKPPTDFPIPPQEEEDSAESVPIPPKAPKLAELPGSSAKDTLSKLPSQAIGSEITTKPLKAGRPPSKSVKDPKTTASKEQNSLSDELSALPDEGVEGPEKNLLPMGKLTTPSAEDKFQIGRKENFPVPRKEIKQLPSEAPIKIPTIQASDPTLTETKLEKQERLARQKEIKDVFKRDWAAYKEFAWMHDELKPVTNGSNDPFGGWGATLVDALDTMLIMDLNEEYMEASEAVAQIDFTYTASKTIPLFETTIRYLGGLLAAYDLGVSKGKKDSVMLTQAKTLGQVLFGAFDTPNRLPSLKYDYRKQAASSTPMRAESSGVMSEAGSLSVEFTRLAQLSDGEDRHKYFDAIQRITDAFEESMEYMAIDGLWPLRLDFSGCEPITTATAKAQPTTIIKPSNVPNAVKAGAKSIEKAKQATDELLDALKTQDSVGKKAKGEPQKRQVRPPPAPIREDQATTDTIVSETECKKQGIRPAANAVAQTFSQGGLADSTYEYFTKEYLLLGGISAAEQYQRLYEKSIDATKENLLFKPLVPGNLGASQLLMSGDLTVVKGKDSEFSPKTQHLTCFVGGMFAMGSKVFSRPEDLKLAAKLTEGCVWAYTYTPTGVMPETFSLHECKDKTCDWQDFIDKEARSSTAQTSPASASVPEWATDAAEERKLAAQAATGVKKPQVDVFKRQSAPDTRNKAASLTEKNFEQSQLSKSRTPTMPGESAADKVMFYVDARYILRPEAIESVWYMYRITGDKTWQEKGWKMWQATEALTRTKIAHSAVANIMDPARVHLNDSLESFWFAETLKYYYLLFSDFSTISLDEWVLNTEAHPFKLDRTEAAT